MEKNSVESADLSALKIDRSRKNKPPGRWKRWLHLLWLLVPFILYYGYHYGLREAKPAVSIQTGRVTLVTGNDAAAELVATGYVVAQVKAAIASKGSGRLRILNVEEGDRIDSGEVVAELENDDVMAQLAIARANLKLALADSIAAELNFNRQTKLHASGHTTDEVLEGAIAVYHKALASVEASRAAIVASEVELDNTIIVAPFDGTVMTKDADVGEVVAPFASGGSSRGAVVTMADMSTLEVEADVSESNIEKVIVGGPCEIILDAYPRDKYPGFVKKIVPTADRTRATVRTKIAFSKLDHRVLPEMSARVNFLPVKDQQEKVEQQPVLVAPKNAITQRDGQLVVFTIGEGLAVMKPVTTGRQLGDVTEITSGLTEGETVILNPAGGLKAGDKVDVSL